MDDVERQIERHDVRLCAVESKVDAVAEKHGQRIGALEVGLGAHGEKVRAHGGRLDLISTVFSTAFDIHPGSEMKDAVTRRDRDAIHTALLSDIRAAVRWSVATGGVLIVLAVIGIILMNGPAVLGAVGQLGGIR